MTPPPPGPEPSPADATGDGRDAAGEALAGARWVEARDGFAALLRVDATDAEAWNGVATAQWWLDDGPSCLAARESAYRAAREAGDLRSAATAAATLGYDAALFGQGSAVALGWLGRARALLDGLPEAGPEHGWLAMREAELALQVTHRPDVAHRAAREAVDLGHALGRADLAVVGEGLLGLDDVLRGGLQAGMQRLDAAVAAALTGELPDLMWAGKVCCWLVVACRQAQDLPRALEWCERVDALCREHDLAPLLTACRIHHASVRLASGHWIDAERELVAAIERMHGSRRATRTDAVVQLAHLRRRQGRLDEADALYAQAGYAAQALVGRALVHLERGEASAAWTLAADVLDDVPVDDRLARGTVLLPVVRCAVAVGDAGAAGAARDELMGIAEGVGTDALRAAAAAARALVAGGPNRDPRGARAAWRAAARAFHRAGLPVDEAEARLALARLLGDEPLAAEMEVQAAVATLEEVEAPERLAAARDVLAAPRRRDPGSLTTRELEVLRLVAEGRSTGQIAASLVLSEHTVHRHVANILTRLGEPTRAAAVAHAARAGIL
ncbi:helix-turn-helix transcriptional regulator [Phycicoccus sp. MAQZ13P-2]|uniref:helix-turn-helix domain-containing protein n=1 Tax=Phycicoccus mangrovi TaxID=2840470 RepID=UPI001C000C71|nr:helix-turn-helix transcriptional regulator [Phycicoccus mangrovi]MBT9258086.1 helix-turn-helix transcriptional regulator [Phycicoccus mangrovi]MBT9276297.1 helix-turn-helix transcriptional regulator [Phycicoccus mangrovi]